MTEKGCGDYIVHVKKPEEFIDTFAKVTRVAQTRKSDRKIVTIIDQSQMSRLLSNKELNYISNFLAVVRIDESIDLVSNDAFDLVTNNFMGPNRDPTLPILLDHWGPDGLKFNANLFPHDISDLHGNILRVAALTYKPFVLLDLDTSIAPKSYDGVEMRLMEEFCRRINCVIEVVRDDGNYWGDTFDNYTGIGIFGMLIEDKADFGVSALYPWYKQSLVLDYSCPTQRTAATCITPAARLQGGWNLPFLPFNWNMWTALIVTFILASSSLAFAQRGSISQAFLTTFGIMVTQSQSDPGNSWRIRSIIGWILITGLVIDNAYSSRLVSSFTVRKYERSVDTIQDIVDRNLEWGANDEAWAYALTLSDEPLIQQLLKLFRVYTDEELGIKLFQRNFAFSIEKLPGGTLSLSDYITPEGAKNLELMVQDLYSGYCVVMLRKSSPYTEKISQFIGQLQSCGLILAWETQSMTAYSSRLVSSFTVPIYESSVDTIQDIVDRNLEWGANDEAWAYALTLSDEPLIQQLLKLFRVYTDEELGIKLFQRNFAFSIEKLPGGTLSLSDYITPEGAKNLELMVQDLYSGYCVVMLRKSSPYTEKISQFIGQLQSCGLILAWETQVTLKYLNNALQLTLKLSRTKESINEGKPFDISQMKGIFMLYFAGVTLSCMTFAIEVIVINKTKE